MFLAHSLQQLRMPVMSFWLKMTSRTQKKKGQFKVASNDPTQPPTQAMPESSTSPTWQTPDASANCFQNHLGTSATVSILIPSRWYLLRMFLIQLRRVVRTQSFSCLRSARLANLQFSMRSWLWLLKSSPEMVQKSWQWLESLKGWFGEKLVSRLPMWLATTSSITRMPRSWQALTMETKSYSLPKLSLSPSMSVAQYPWQPPSRLATIGDIHMASKPMPWMQSKLLVIPRYPPPQYCPNSISQYLGCRTCCALRPHARSGPSTAGRSIVSSTPTCPPRLTDPPRPR